MSKKRLVIPYIWTVIAAGAVVIVWAAFSLPVAKLDWGFAVLALVTVAISSRMTAQVPSVSGHVSASDTLIFLILLLYGSEAAILVAAAEALSSSLLFGQKSIKIRWNTVLFNSGMIAFSTFATAMVLRFLFGDVTKLTAGPFSGQFVLALALMALVDYLANAFLAAVHTSFKIEQSVLSTWKKYYLWAAVTYFAGASAAGLTAKAVGEVGFYAVIAVTPIIAFIFFTYRTYLKKTEAIAAAAKAKADQRQAEELSQYLSEQERLREQFSHMEKMSALGELASGVAHDFNNTLAGILGRAQLLQSTNDPEQIRRGLQIIVQTAEDGAKTIRRIQDFARQRRDHDFEPVAVGQLLLDVSEITRPRWKNRAEASNVQIDLDLQIDTLAMVMGDASELREVLVNMVFNAIDAMPDGGVLTLAARDADQQVQISISDTGTGMSPDVHTRIFDPFFTTKGKAGMGLGLAVSYGIIRRHDGTIDVDSDVGKGTVFSINLPIAGESAVGGAASPTVIAEPPAVVPPPARTLDPELGPTRILIVDDEEYVRELLRDILVAEGCQITEAAKGREALALLERGEFDALFTDVGMPGMSGWELAEQVRERDARLPIAVITGWGEAVGSSEQKQAQVNWIVPKPFSVTRIVEVLRAVQDLKAAGLTSISDIVAA
jgi:signal transduction histidine kinase/ActR/RegA family two-component response regulator